LGDIIQEWIEINPEVMLGKPVIHGTRITFELILRKLSEGSTEADLLEAYPCMTKQEIQAESADVILIRFPGNARSELSEAISKLVIEKEAKNYQVPSW